MFTEKDILYEDNHLLVVNKAAGQLVQADPTGDPALEDEVKAFIKRRDRKAGNVFLGVVHRIDRPVSGLVLLAKSRKALVRLNETVRDRRIRKTYWAVVEHSPEEPEGTLRHYIARNPRTNRSYAHDTPRGDAKEAVLHYRVLVRGTHYTLLEVDLVTGRHHQIRCQLSRIGCPIRGDLKYGASRSNRDGGISLHARSIELPHPVRREPLKVTAPVPSGDRLWRFFEESV